MTGGQCRANRRAVDCVFIGRQFSPPQALGGENAEEEVTWPWGQCWRTSEAAVTPLRSVTPVEARHRWGADLPTSLSLEKRGGGTSLNGTVILP